MNTRKFFHLAAVAVLLLTTFASAGRAMALTKCPASIIVQWGDTLSGIAARCGVTVDAIRAANPGLGWWLYAGQTLYIPGGSSTPNNPPPTGGTYVVQRGDTLNKIATRMGTTLKALLAVNPQISNPNLIYVGQVINLSAGTKPPSPAPTQPPGVPPSPYVSYALLKVAYEGGLFIRSDPGGPIIASALYKTSWYYDLNSVFVDKKWKVWVQVKINPPVKGYSTGWILVRDQYWKYFTNPKIDP